MRREEDAIQRAVFQHLEARGAADVFAFHPANGGFRRPIEARILKGLGVKSGVPDLIIIRGGHVYALELKIPGGKLSDNQIATMIAMRLAGVEVDVAYGLDDALKWLEKWKILKGKAT